MFVKGLDRRVVLLCTAAFLVPAHAWAQSADGNSDTNVETIVVSAQKRNEVLKEVPSSISLVSGTQIDQQHIVGYADLGRTVPDLSFSSWGGPGLSNIEIRGISSSEGASTVSVYLDDAPITIRNNSFYSGQTEPYLFDIAHVEVLRGPQGTLYGASAMGGTIIFVSKAVNLDQFEGSGEGDLSQTQDGGVNSTMKVVANVPLIQDKLGIRVGAEIDHQSGYVDHADTSGNIDQTNINSSEAKVYKVSMLWNATPNLTIAPSFFYQRVAIGDTGLVDLATPHYVTKKLVLEPGVDTMEVPSLKVSYNLGWADLISVTSYAYRHFPRTTDGTYFNSEFVGGFVDSLGVTGLDGNLDGYKLSALPGPVYNSIVNRQFTQEVRLVSKDYDPAGHNPLTWIAGLYYSNSRNHGTSAQYIPGFNDTFLATYGVTSESVLGAAIPNDLFYAFSTHHNDAVYAAFGELTYHIIPELKLTAGLRYAYARSSLATISSGFFAGAPFPGQNTKAYALTPRFSLSYDMTRDFTVYATAGKGYRLGGINTPVPVPQCSTDLAAFGLTTAPTSYSPDELWNYEVGGKGTFLNGLLTVNTSLYDIEWNKIQIDVPLKTCGFSFTANAGKAQSYGLEAEFIVRPWESLTLQASGQYNHDTFQASVPALGVNKGDPVPESPSWSLNLAANYEHPLTSNVSGFVRANWQFIGRSYGTIVKSNPDYHRPAYDLAGMSIGVDFDPWEVSAFVKNLFDEAKVIQRPADNYVAEGYTPTPRTVGVSVRVRY